tara:strand:- start:84 stop:398 length:315 start_codon:yes stop_codon:yes gene_type:complete
MVNNPPMPSFPQGCTYSLLILFSIFILSIIINEFTKTKDPINPNKKKSNSIVSRIIIITLIIFIIISISCGWYYNLKKKQWIYNYGTDFQKSVQLASDILSVVN